jgi:DNA-directed RNA polymerase specialized sigma24 family protein
MDNSTGWMVSCLKNECFQHFKASKRFKLLNEEEQEEEILEVEGLMYEEIGEYLEISLEQVKDNLHRARKTLREFLMQKKNERLVREIVG